MTPATEAAIRVLWEETPQTAAQIGALHGVTKNVVVGRAYRRGWEARRLARRPHRTIHDRLDAHWAKLDKVLAETEPTIRSRLAEAEE